MMKTTLEIINFKRDEGTLKTSARGWKIGKYLSVSRNRKGGNWFKIFNLITGKPVIDVRFGEEEDATEVAKWLDAHFGDFFPIWEIYPEADVFSLAKWSVTSGIQVYETIQHLPDIVDLDTVAETYHGAKDRVKDWTRFAR